MLALKHRWHERGPIKPSKMQVTTPDWIEASSGLLAGPGLASLHEAQSFGCLGGDCFHASIFRRRCFRSSFKATLFHVSGAKCYGQMCQIASAEPIFRKHSIKDEEPQRVTKFT